MPGLLSAFLALVLASALVPPVSGFAAIPIHVVTDPSHVPAYSYDADDHMAAATTTPPVDPAIRSVQTSASRSGFIYDVSDYRYATNAIPKFDLHPRVLDQLDDVRMGPLQGQLTPDDL